MTPIGFRCPSCGAERFNPEARDPPGQFRAIVEQVAPKLCAACRGELVTGDAQPDHMDWFACPVHGRFCAPSGHEQAPRDLIRHPCSIKLTIAWASAIGLPIA